jgi:hypothetical protein
MRVYNLPFGGWKLWQLLAALLLVMAVAVAVVLADPASKPAPLSLAMRAGQSTSLHGGLTAKAALMRPTCE